jgi:hypothetical protein
MNKANLLSELQLIYGAECQICYQEIANTFIHLVPLKVVRYARNLNKRKNRQHKRKLPEITNYQLNNLLPTCSECQVKQFKLDIYKLLSSEQLKIIDKQRKRLGYPELLTAGNIRMLHKLLINNNQI